MRFDEWQRIVDHAMIRAGRASLQANVTSQVRPENCTCPMLSHAAWCPASLPVPADVAALIAGLNDPTDLRDLRFEAARVLQSQQQELIDTQTEVGNQMHWRDQAEARVAELEAALRIFDPGLNSLDANKVPPLQINEQTR